MIVACYHAQTQLYFANFSRKSTQSAQRCRYLPENSSHVLDLDFPLDWENCTLTQQFPPFSRLLPVSFPSCSRLQMLGCLKEISRSGSPSQLLERFVLFSSHIRLTTNQLSATLSTIRMESTRGKFTVSNRAPYEVQFEVLTKQNRVTQHSLLATLFSMKGVSSK